MCLHVQVSEISCAQVSAWPVLMAVSGGIYHYIYIYTSFSDTPTVGKSSGFGNSLGLHGKSTTLSVSLVHAIAPMDVFFLQTRRSAFASSTITTRAASTILEASRHWVLCFYCKSVDNGAMYIYIYICMYIYIYI